MDNSQEVVFESTLEPSTFMSNNNLDAPSRKQSNINEQNADHSAISQNTGKYMISLLFSHP